MDAISNILNNPLLLNLVGYAVSYVPGLRAVVAQRVIPYLNVAIAFLVKVFTPDAAPVVGALSAPDLMLAGVSFAGLLGFATDLGAALMQAGQAYIFHRMIGRRALPAVPKDSKL